MRGVRMEDLKGITPYALDRYLCLLGWSKDLEFANHDMWKFFDPRNPDDQVLVPARDDFPDFLLRVDNLINILGDINSKEKWEIVRDLKTTYFDRLEFRIIAPFSEAGKLPLDYAADCIEGIKNLILYSACAEQEAKPVCLKAGNRAKEALGRFELGQTEIGSFVINVGAKVADENDDHLIKLIEPTPKIEHKIVERISTAIQQVERITSREKSLTDMAADAYKEGVTANMCEALLKLKPSDNQQIELETTIRYASAITDKIGNKSVAKLGEVHFAVMRELADIYRNNTIVQDMALVGIIKKMQLHNKEEHTIAIECQVDKGKRIVQAALSEEQHRLACDAYETTLMVRISGVVDKSKKIWTISEIVSFEILSEEGIVINKA